MVVLAPVKSVRVLYCTVGVVRSSQRLHEWVGAVDAVGAGTAVRVLMEADIVVRVFVGGHAVCWSMWLQRECLREWAGTVVSGHVLSGCLWEWTKIVEAGGCSGSVCRSGWCLAVSVFAGADRHRKETVQLCLCPILLNIFYGCYLKHGCQIFTI